MTAGEMGDDATSLASDPSDRLGRLRPIYNTELVQPLLASDGVFLFDL